MRELAIPCPHCDPQTTVADLLRYVEAEAVAERGARSLRDTFGLLLPVEFGKRAAGQGDPDMG